MDVQQPEQIVYFYFSIQIMTLFPLSEMNVTRPFPAVCKTSRNSSASPYHFSPSAFRAGHCLTCAVLWRVLRGLGRSSIPNVFGGCHPVKWVGKCELLDMPTLHLHPSSPRLPVIFTMNVPVISQVLRLCVLYL